MEEDAKSRKLISSSMVDLKAELFRKQEEFRKQKEKNASFIKPKKSVKDKSIWSKQNPGVLARAQNDLNNKEKDEEEEEMLAKSRRILEQKTKMYDSITSSSTIPEEDGSKYYVVDFQKKAIDAIVEERESRRNFDKQKEEEEAEKRALLVEIPEASCPEDEWVDFVDSLGRERRCMRRDLSALMKKDQELAISSMEKKSSIKAGDNSKPGDNFKISEALPQLMSQDMHRELMRQKWENEAKELLEKGQDEVHYSNVQFDEIRAHGVGFYQFSKDHSKRQEELERLQKLREETMKQQSTKEKIKDKRKALLEARLAKVRQRRKLKEEVVEDEKLTQHIGDKNNPTLEGEDSALLSKTDGDIKKEEEAKEAEEKRKNHVREWDKDKQDSTWGVKNYVSARRNERENEFAPPPLYFEENKSTKKPKDSNNVLSDNERLTRLQESIAAQHSNQQSTTNKASITVDKPSFKTSNSFNSIPLPAGAVNTESVSHNIECGMPLHSNNSHYIMPQPSTSGLQQQHHTTHAVPQLCLSEQTNRSRQNWDPPAQVMPSQYHYNSGQSHMWQAMPPNNQYSQYYTCGQSSEGPQVWNPNQQIPDDNNTQNSYGPHPISVATSSSSSNTVTAGTTSGKPKNKWSNSSKQKQQTCEPPSPKKPKVPKLSVVDLRFMNNTDTSSINPEPGKVPDVVGVPYQPGTFSKYRPQGGDGSSNSAIDGAQCGREGVQDSVEISGGPLIYTKEQLARQQQELDEDTDQPDKGDSDDDRKLQEFLSSI